MAISIPHLAFPLAVQPNGSRPNLFGGSLSGGVNSYRTVAGATVTEDPAVFHDTAPGTKVVTANANVLEGADSGSVIAVREGFTYPVAGWVKGNSGGEALYLFAGDGKLGNVAQGFTATTEWQLVEAELTATASGLTGIAVATRVKAGVTFWVSDLKFLGPVPLAFSTVEQDSIEEIGDCVEAALRTPVGSRIDAPSYGIPDGTFEQLSPDPSVEPYLSAVAAAEPRAHLLAESEIEDVTERITIRSAP